MKLAFGMIVFESDYVLKECLEQVYPFAEQILIAEGPVSYWQRMGKTTSEDETNHILNTFPDPDKKIIITHGQYSEKDEQCQAYMKNLRPDIDYLFNLDSDEVYKTEDLKKIIKILEEYKPARIAVRSCSFYGGFDHYLNGFELGKDNFLRIFRVTPGCSWEKHRPPTIRYPDNANINWMHIDSETLWNNFGVQMYHYSYVFPKQVFNKVGYYKSDISKENCIDDYFNQVYLPWVIGDENQRKNIEEKYEGVHEFKPNVRGYCGTSKFDGTHPEAIFKNLENLKLKFNKQLKEYV